jgi:hypothetical protein
MTDRLHAGARAGADVEDADQVDEACEGAGVVTALRSDLLESAAHGVGVDVHLFGRLGDVEVGVGEARIVLMATARSSSGIARRLLPLEAMIVLVAAVAPMSAHSRDERSSSERIGRLGDV